MKQSMGNMFRMSLYDSDRIITLESARLEGRSEKAKRAGRKSSGLTKNNKTVIRF